MLSLTCSHAWASPAALLACTTAMSAAPLVTAAAQSTTVVASATYVRPQQMVAIDGTRRINLYCTGSGQPVVLLDAGAGENMMVWRHVQRQLAAETRVCSYDRAGYGFSDSATGPSDAQHAVDDIHRLLRAGRIRTPIVYVGHSAAGLYGTLLVARYPGDVAGAVLVDPAVAHAEARMLATFPPGDRAKLTNFYAGVLTVLRQCLALARAGALVQLATPEAMACVDTKGYRDAIDDTLRRELARQYAQPKLMAAALSEYGSVWPGTDLTSVNSRQIDATRGGFGDRPLIVLAHDGSNDSPPPGFSAAQQATFESIRMTELKALASTSSQGTVAIVPHSAHHIQFDQPDSVVAAVRRVVASVRHRAR